MSETGATPAPVAGATWALPEVRGPVVTFRGRSGSAAAAASDARAGYDEGFRKGREEGLAAVRAEASAQSRRVDETFAHLQALLAGIARPLERLDEEAAAELARLALLTGAQLARRELQVDPSQVIAIIRDCVQLLPASARDVRVHLHPQDAAVVRERLATPAAERAWTLVEDPVMGRGGCRVVAEHSQVDARLESRIAAAVAAVLGDARHPSRQAGVDDDAAV
jgi:flagellar assembly protein FliH